MNNQIELIIIRKLPLYQVVNYEENNLPNLCPIGCLMRIVEREPCHEEDIFSLDRTSWKNTRNFYLYIWPNEHKDLMTKE